MSGHGNRWLAGLVMAGVVDAADLSRARGLVGRGAVADLEIEPGAVRAVVRGRGAVERRVGLGVRRWNDAVWAVVRAELSVNGRILAAVLDGSLPDEVTERLDAAGTPLLPPPADVSLDCSCERHTDRCVHAAALCVRVADELDADPFLAVTLRGGDRAALAAPAPERRPARRRPLGDGVIVATTPDPWGHIGFDGRPDDPGMAATTAWRRGLEPLPVWSPRRLGGASGAAPVASVPPPAELGLDPRGLEWLVTDARRRAARMLAGDGGSGLDLTEVGDAVRRLAEATLADDPDTAAAHVAELAGVDPDGVDRLVDAWRCCGAAGVDVLVAPRRLDDAEVAAVTAAAEQVPRNRSTGAVLDGGRQLRRATDGTWVLLVADPAGGWTVTESAAALDELV